MQKWFCKIKLPCVPGGVGVSCFSSYVRDTANLYECIKDIEPTQYGEFCSHNSPGQGHNDA